jgi:hypothetical protein
VHSALKREHPAFQNLNFFLYLWVIFVLVDPNPDPAAQINADPDTDPDPQPCLHVSLVTGNVFAVDDDKVFLSSLLHFIAC